MKTKAKQAQPSPVADNQVKADKAAPTLAQVITDKVNQAKAIPDAGDRLQALHSIVEELDAAMPEKVQFSSDRAKRKEQMKAYADAKHALQPLVRLVHDALAEDGAADHQRRFGIHRATSGAVTATEIRRHKLGGKFRAIRL